MNHLSFLAVRILAIVLILGNASSLLVLSDIFDGESFRPNHAWQVLAVIAPIIIGLLLWKFSKLTAYIVFPDKSIEVPVVSGENIVSGGTFLIGLYLLLEAIIRVPNIAMTSPLVPIFKSQEGFIAELVTLLVQFCIAAALLIKREMVLKMYRKLSYENT
ncbi:hypothetical protein [Simiduia aestuariiviva]|uniref:Uncharacterized protein n=1 Tax=Simiduia aestuariiviva TaxID=1510459 RepID=A0A839UQA1_9GAMM|nr:hypothetical protein [Simiduia aestuariiviva]MBB3170022.1 hypothetical protein [Simiduia aestuariiviva]